MLGLLRPKNARNQAAKDIYRALLINIRQPAFYESMGVPDSFNGRFDLLLLHMFLVINHTLDQTGFNQDLFDIMFADMDQTLREQGIGDMGVPKHMKRMMKAFNGRMLAYQAALAGPASSLEDVLKRNLYGTVPAIDAGSVSAMAAYLKSANAGLDAPNILNGRVAFPKAGSNGQG